MPHSSGPSSLPLSIVLSTLMGILADLGLLVKSTRGQLGAGYKLRYIGGIKGMGTSWLTKGGLARGDGRPFWVNTAPMGIVDPARRQHEAD